MDPGIETRVENLVHRVACTCSLPFCQRKWQKAEQGRPSCQRLADRIGEPELLATCQYEEAVPSLFVSKDLQVRQQFGNVLDLVDYGTLAELREKTSRIRFGKISLVRRLQVGILQIRKGCPAKRCLARLSWTGHGHKGILLEQRDQTGCDFALVPVACIYCKYSLQFTHNE